MNRSPLAAWRRLFAIGGAPAASHQVLSRAPSSERLLQPLAGARVINTDRLEALTRPLDIGGALSRVTTATPETRNPDMSDAKVRRARAEQVAEVVHDVRTTREQPVPYVPASRARFAATGASNGATDSESPTTRFLTSSATQPVRAHPMLPATPSSVRGKPISRFANVSPQGQTPRPFVSVGLESAPPVWHANTTAATANGANSRVIVTAAVADINRLLAVGSPGAVVASANSNATRAPRAESRAADSTPRDVVGLLADAVDRARATMSASAVTTPDQSHAGAQQTFASTPEAYRAASHAPATTDAVGGFRGLAQRTLVSTRTARRAAPHRIEAEHHVSTDLTLDSLDSRVADSLARVLEREARRHGIDLAEARA